MKKIWKFSANHPWEKIKKGPPSPGGCWIARTHPVRGTRCVATAAQLVDVVTVHLGPGRPGPPPRDAHHPVCIRSEVALIGLDGHSPHPLVPRQPGHQCVPSSCPRSEAACGAKPFWKWMLGFVVPGWGATLCGAPCPSAWWRSC